MKKDSFYEDALQYHRKPNGPGKISIKPTKDLITQRDLALAYSPGVAAPCKEIEANPETAYDYTAKGNLVAVITNGTAVLGLGDIGPLASKPVMEGKSVLFKKFANIDSIDLEVDEKDIDKFVDIVASLEPSFGGINLEDIKAPECFEIEKRLKERMNIPVFHDDQHGTAIIVAAAFTNWLKYSGNKINKVKLVTSGAGASALSCVKILMSMGLPKENIIMTDRKGVIYQGREDLDAEKTEIATKTKHRTLADAIKGADVFLGLSGPGVLSKEMVDTMHKAPLIMALANPTPEIMPEEVKEVRPNAIICTGRSDYPNQVNNVLCFPFIFRGALDVGATAINEEMKLAAVKALADMTMEQACHDMQDVYGDVPLTFGPEYIIPKPFDTRCILEIPPAVAKAAMETGVATRPIENFDVYRAELERQVYKSGQLMRPIYARAMQDKERLVFAEGEDERVLMAAQTLVDDGIAHPILVGREDVVMSRIQRAGLRLKKDEDFELVNPQSDPRFNDYWSTYHEMLSRKGITPDVAKTIVRTRNTVIAAIMVHKEQADAMICGTIGRYHRHLNHICDIVGKAPGVKACAALNVLIADQGTYFMCDAFVNDNPTAEELRDMTLMAAQEVRRFGIEPKVALLSHSDFGSVDTPSSRKMREATRLIKEEAPELQVEGEMTVTAAIHESVREKALPGAGIKGSANLFVMPNRDAANIAFHMLKSIGNAISVGPLLLGVKKPAHILLPSVSVRGILNASAYACVAASQGKNNEIL